MIKYKNPYEVSVRFRWTDIPTGICYTIALIALGLAIALNFRPLYYWNIEWLDLVKESGYKAVVIKENYNALMDYCSPFFTGTLHFPSLPYSQSAISHFAEVKVLFNIIYIAGAVSLLFCIISFLIKSKNNEYEYLKYCGIISVILPLIVVVFSVINFDKMFILFHKLVFNNDDWLFDPVTDPIINMLPETYFMECALVIALTVIIGSIIAFAVYSGRKRSLKKEVRLLPPKMNYFY